MQNFKYLNDFAVLQRLVAASVFTVLLLLRRHLSRGLDEVQRPGRRSEEHHAGFSGKEVIQPQVPLRLPCYDFTPIIEQTVGASLPCGLGQRLQVHPTFVV